jgi:predicted regulator of Ras-like GTPase activity (Roadblock/LC7/MglB family)
MLLTKNQGKDTAQDKFRMALDYVGEYRGVKGAVIFNKEGLVIGRTELDGFDAESFSPLALLIMQQTDSVLERLDEKSCVAMTIKTPGSWIRFRTIGSLVLVVIASSDTDELLKVRIGQAVDMIKSNLKEKYPLVK